MAGLEVSTYFRGIVHLKMQILPLFSSMNTQIMIFGKMSVFFCPYNESQLGAILFCIPMSFFVKVKSFFTIFSIVFHRRNKVIRHEVEIMMTEFS